MQYTSPMMNIEPLESKCSDVAIYTQTFMPREYRTVDRDCEKQMVLDIETETLYITDGNTRKKIYLPDTEPEMTIVKTFIVDFLKFIREEKE